MGCRYRLPRNLPTVVVNDDKPKLVASEPVISELIQVPEKSLQPCLGCGVLLPHAGS